MYNQNDILLNLNAENYYIDRKTLVLFISSWKIEAVYEDENGENFYDDFAIERIKKGINLKAQGFSDDQIVVKLNKMTDDSETEKQEMTILNPTDTVTTTTAGTGLNNVTLDITTQTLQMLAEAVAGKITDDIKNSDMAEKLIEAGGYKRDNEILSAQISELIEHNKKLSERVEQLEKRGSFIQKIIELFK